MLVIVNFSVIVNFLVMFTNFGHFHSVILIGEVNNPRFYLSYGQLYYHLDLNKMQNGQQSNGQQMALRERYKAG